MNVLVIGCGRLGSRLANNLFHHGHNVSIIDINPTSFSQLDDDFDGLTVIGMPMDMNVLRNAGIETCDAVAVVTSDDNLNITVSQIVREFFYVENVVARVADPARENVFHHFGLKTICPTNLASSAVFSAITQEIPEKQLHFGDCTIGINAREVDPIFIGRNLNSIPVKADQSILGVWRENGEVLLFGGRHKIVLNPKDKILYAMIAD